MSPGTAQHDTDLSVTQDRCCLLIACVVAAMSCDASESVVTACQQVCRNSPLAPPAGACHREIEEAGRRSSQQQELLNKRIAELDSEGRKLRDQKYQLDTQVSPLQWCIIHPFVRGSKPSVPRLLQCWPFLCRRCPLESPPRRSFCLDSITCCKIAWSACS